MANPIASTPTAPANAVAQPRAVSQPEAGAAPEARQPVATSGSSAPAPSVPSPAERQEQSVEELARATESITDYIQTVSRSLSITIDDQLETPVVTVLNRETEEIIRQIPSEEALAIARFIADQTATASSSTEKAVTGLLFNGQA
jgi:flagellar protein FlaG